jgi:hypothetical protein
MMLDLNKVLSVQDVQALRSQQPSSLRQTA